VDKLDDPLKIVSRIIFNGASLSRKTPNEWSFDPSLGELSLSIINNFLFKTNIILI
jgi:hypothetical protein